jgi:hypothetical protein
MNFFGHFLHPVPPNERPITRDAEKRASERYFRDKLDICFDFEKCCTEPIYNFFS